VGQNAGIVIHEGQVGASYKIGTLSAREKHYGYIRKDSRINVLQHGLLNILNESCQIFKCSLKIGLIMTKHLKELYPSCLNFFRTCKKFTVRRSMFIIQVILYVHNVLLA